MSVRHQTSLPSLIVGAVLLTGAVTGCGVLGDPFAGPPARPTAPPHGRPAVSTGDWTRLPDPPLSLRAGPVVAWVDDRLVVVGGDTGPPCPPNADCATDLADVVDGASYDPTTEVWTPIADAPLPIPARVDHAVVGSELFVHVGRRLLRYDAERDAWSWERLPGRQPEWLGLEAAGERLLLVSGSDEEIEQPDRMLDPRTGTWSVLPDDPFGPTYDRSITATPTGLVLVASFIDDAGNPEDPSFPHVARLDRGGTGWQRLPDTDEVLGGYAMTWAGTRLVDPTLGGADGGETNNYGRVIPYGGRLDPVTGDWSPLPDPPEELTGGWPAFASSTTLIATGGWLYEDTADAWTWLTPPEDAPQDPGPAAFAGDQLYVVGGDHNERWDQNSSEYDDFTAENVYDPGAWVLAPPSD